ncbi:MAG: sporulation protein YabP [Eubacterium sp.]|nr:sporulation protein YabP [Eubacterium sp.]
MIQDQLRPQTQTSHRLTMQDREKIELTGVTEVISFDNKEILLETIEGALRFGGEGLHVKRLTLERGEIAIEGRIQEISYHESSRDKTAGSFLGRLFR